MRSPLVASDLLPEVSLTNHLDSLVQSCDHPGTCIYAKTTKSGGLIYFACCTECGASMPQPKGALSHATIAKTHRVEDIPSKSDADRIRGQYTDWRRFHKQGAMDRYTLHLQSQRWKALRDRVIDRDKHCALCECPIECVHHITYERLFDESLHDLIGLCNPCHDQVHGRKVL